MISRPCPECGADDFHLGHCPVMQRLEVELQKPAPLPNDGTNAPPGWIDRGGWWFKFIEATGQWEPQYPSGGAVRIVQGDDR